MAKVINEITDALRVKVLNPRAGKASGDGECGLYALTHSVADFCALAEENETRQPGDVELRAKYAQFKEKLAASVLPAYQAYYPDATVAHFINDLRRAEPKAREAIFSPFFRNILANKVQGLSVEEFNRFKISLEGDKQKYTQAVYLENLKKKGNNFNVDELGYVLQELGLRGRIYSMNAQNKGQYYDVGDANNNISYIKLINQNEHWEWIAKSPEDAKAHNDKFTDAKKPGLLDSKVSAKLPDDMQNILKQFGISEDSFISMVLKAVMALFGFAKTASKLFNPDQPLEGEELQMPGAESMAKAITALGENGKGLNQALRKAATSDNKEEGLKAVFDDAVKRLIANKQYDEADALLKSQETVVIDTLKKTQDMPTQMAAAMYNQAATEISTTGLAPQMSDEFRRQNFNTRLEMLKECYNVNKEVNALEAAPAVLSNTAQSSDASILAARNDAKTAKLMAGGQKLCTLYNGYSAALAAERQQQAARAAAAQQPQPVNLEAEPVLRQALRAH